MIHLTFAALLLNPNSVGDKTISDLAKTMAAVSKRSAIAVTPSNMKVAVAEDPKDTSEVVDPLRKDGFASLVSDVAVVYKIGIPKSHWGVLTGLIASDKNPEAQAKTVNIPQTAVKEGKITFETKSDEIVRVGTLMNLDLPKRIMVSPYFNFDSTNDFPLAISAKDMGASDFAKALARGLGGKFMTDAKTYTIAFDPQAFRTNVQKLIALAQAGVDAGRMPSAGNSQLRDGGSYSDYQEYQQATMPAQSNSKSSVKAALNLLSQTISQMSDQLLEQTFAYKGTSTRLNMATITALQNPAVTYLQSLTQSNSQNGADVRRNNGGAPDATTLLRRVNRTNPGRIVITTEFRVTLELNMAGGRPGRNSDAGDNTISIQVL